MDGMMLREIIWGGCERNRAWERASRVNDA